jgi:S1-C subfamily serine protease
MMKRRVLFSVLVVALLAVSLGAPLAAAQTEPAGELGLVIVRVDADGPAAEAGVQRGDILLAMEGQEINRPLDWFRALRTLEAGNDVELQVLHGDDERTLTATVAERNSRAWLGLQVYLGGAEDTAASEPLLLPLVTPVVGAQVIEVVDDSPASAAGLQADDVITAVDGQALDGDASLADVIGGYQPGDEVTLTVTRAGEEEALTPPAPSWAFAIAIPPCSAACKSRCCPSSSAEATARACPSSRPLAIRTRPLPCPLAIRPCRKGP